MRRILLLLPAFVVATASCAANSQLGPASRVRISAPDVSPHRLVGEVSSLGGDTLTLMLDETEALEPVPLVSVERIEVSRGFVRGNAILTLAGGGIGAGVGIAVAANATSEDCVGDLCDLNQLAWLAVPAFMGIGAFVGWLAGVPFFETERWKEMPLDQLRVSFVPQPDGRVRLAAFFSF